MILLEMRGLSFGYGKGQPVIDDVFVTVSKGVHLGLVGESGSGKSTLLRLILGLVRPESGSIKFDGVQLEPADRRFMRKYRQSVQAVLQDPYSSLDPRQKVRDIVLEPLQSLGVPGNHRQMVAHALDAVGLPGNALERYPHTFSGGQRQRIAIARAIVARPQLLLADEAVSGLDLATRIRVIELLHRLSANLTVVFVSHDLAAVAALCEDIVILQQGRVVESGKTSAILQAPQHPYTRKLLASVPRLSV
jgi:peptide/nickel transport system ATP-binding protein